MKETFCWIDGSCKSGGEGGWGFHMKLGDGTIVERYGSVLDTQAKVMEYRAVAEALEALPDQARATIFSDNLSLAENLTKKLEVWRVSLKKVDPLILASIERILRAIDEKNLSLKFQWVRGHNGNVGNERADALAAQGAREARAAK